MDYLFIFSLAAISTFVQGYFEDKFSSTFWFMFGWVSGMFCLVGASIISGGTP